MKKSTLDFVDKLRVATTQKQSLDALVSEIRFRGFSEVKYGFAAIPDATNIDVTFLGEYKNIEHEKIYLEESFADNDYILQHCQTSTELLSFADISRKLQDGEFTGKQRYVHEVSIENGFINGICIPLRDQNKLSKGGLTIVGDNDINTKEFDKFLTETAPSLKQMAEAFHCNLKRPLLVNEKDQLTEREKECLLWSIYGLQVKQIADRMGTHPKTVEKQLSSARKRLKARTTVQATIKAMILGLIEP